MTYLVFPVIIVGLVYLIYESVMEPVRFNKEVERRTEVSIDRLKNIRTLQEAYKSKTGRYLSTTDSLIDFYHNGTITIVKQIGSMDDSIAVASKLVKREIIEVAVKDTLLKNKSHVIDSIKYIPFSGGRLVQMESVVKQVSGVNIPLFEAVIPYDDLLVGLERIEAKWFPAAKSKTIHLCYEGEDLDLKKIRQTIENHGLIIGDMNMSRVIVSKQTFLHYTVKSPAGTIYTALIKDLDEIGSLTEFSITD